MANLWDKEHVLRIQINPKRVQVWQRLQQIECSAEQVSAAQTGKGPALESSPPLNAVNHSGNRAARTGAHLDTLCISLC